MNSFINTLFRMFFSAIGVAAIFMVAGGIVYAKIYYGANGDGKPLPLRQSIATVLLLGYLGGLFTVTLFLRTTGDSTIQWHLFRAFREAWNTFTIQMWLNPLLNIGVFVPLGILLPLITDAFRRWYTVLIIGASGSFLIETVQYVFCLGSADIDDLFCNILGTMVGFCLCMVALSALRKKPSSCVRYAILPVLSVVTLVGVFIAYYVQPYGNLANAPAFTAYTKDVDWVLKCNLSNEPMVATIYWAEPYDRVSCDTFCTEFAQRVGINVSSERFDAAYYDNTTYYSDHAGFYISVDLNDRAYCASVPIENVTGKKHIEMGENELRSFFKELDVYIPAEATFFREMTGPWSGWTSFQANLIKAGNTVVDGVLRCWMPTDGVLLIENSISVYTTWSVEPILSEMQAYDRLCRGEFSNGQWFEVCAPHEVKILSCTLKYIADSKGFYQPVYEFELEGLNPVFIPALLN